MLNIYNWLFLVLILSISCDAASKSFNPDSVKIPVHAIQISSNIDGIGAKTLMACDNDDCMIDVMNPNERDALYRVQAIPEGEYTFAHFKLCSPESEVFYADFRGDFQIGSTKYYSHTIEGFKEKQGSEVNQYVRVPFNRCTFSYRFQQPLIVKDTQTIDLNMVMETKNLSWASIDEKSLDDESIKKESSKELDNGCFEYKIYDQKVFSICMGFPHIALKTGTSLPTVEEYAFYTNEVSDSSGVLMLLIDSDKTIVGGWMRRVFSESSKPLKISEFDAPLNIIQINKDGELTFDTLGSIDHPIYIQFPSFKRSSHDGYYVNRFGVEYQYKVAKITE